MMAIPRVRASVVCRHDGRVLTVRAADAVTGARYLFLPGGAIEGTESPAAAAERETLEESGYRVTADPAAEIILDYPFRWSGKDYDCRTHFFRAALRDPAAVPAPVEDPDCLLGAEWVAVEDAAATFAYHDAIRRAVLALM